MNRRQFLTWAAGTAAAAALTGGYTVFIERYLVRFSRYTIAVPRLPPAFDGLRIAHVTDVHYGSLVPFEFVESLVEKIGSLAKDVVVCTGDYIHERNSTAQIDRVWPLLSRLEAPHGVYSVLGNHDHWGDTDRSLHWLERSGQDVRGKARTIERGGERLWFVGAGDLWEDNLDLDDALSQVPDEECRVVLAHNPDTADGPHRGRIDLMLAGHTHGGQVRIPFVGAPVLPVRNKAYSSGVLETGRGEPLFISRGIGWAIYPVRFNCFPEIPILELRRGGPVENHA